VPELLESVSFAQNRYHRWDVWRHTLRCVDAAPPDLVVRLAALLHDVAKPRSAAPKEGAPGENTFYDHEKLGARLATDILQRLKFPRRETERVALLVAEHNCITCQSGTTPPCAGCWRASDRKRFRRSGCCGAPI